MIFNRWKSLRERLERPKGETGTKWSLGKRDPVAERSALRGHARISQQLIDTRCFCPKPMIGDNQCCHGLDDGNCARNDTGVVTAFAFEEHGISFVINAVLRLHDGGNGLERNAELDVSAIADAT